MVVKSGMFNSINRDRVYKAEDFASYFASFIGNGVFPNPSTGLQVTTGAGLSIMVNPGRGWIHGYYVVNDAALNIILDPADQLLKRIDRVVMRLNYVDRLIDIAVLKGDLSANPQPKALRRDVDYWELALADVMVTNGALQILQANITDQRLNNAVCGIVHGVINQVDTTTIFNQYQSWFDNFSVTKAQEFVTWQNNITAATEEWIQAEELEFENWSTEQQRIYEAWSTGRKEEFDQWFANIKANLDENAAGNLQNQIDDHKAASRPHQFLDSSNNVVYTYGLQRNPELDAAAFVYGIPGDPNANVINLPTYEQLIDMLSRLGNLNSPPLNAHTANMNAKINWMADNINHTQWLIGQSQIPYGHKIFQQSGTFNVPTGVKTVYVTMTGGGGGGGGGSMGGTFAMSGGGGGAGAACYRVPIDVSQTPNIPVTVGVGGAGGLGEIYNQRAATGGATGGTTAFKDVTVIGGEPGGPGVTNNTGIVSRGGAAGRWSAYLNRLTNPQFINNIFDAFTFLYGTNGGEVRGSSNVGNSTPGAGGSYFISNAGLNKEDIYKFNNILATFMSMGLGHGGRGGAASTTAGLAPGENGVKGNDGVVIIEWGEVI